MNIAQASDGLSRAGQKYPAWTGLPPVYQNDD